MSALAEPQLVGRVPAARCCTDHDDPVVALCSVCHRPLCGAHDTATGLPELRDSLRWFGGVLRALAGRGSRRQQVTWSVGHRSGSEPDADEDRVLVLEEGSAATRPEHARERERHLCPSCVPWDRWNDPEIRAGFVTLVVGALVLLLAPDAVGSVVAVVLIALGGARVATRLVRSHLRRRLRRHLAPLLGVDPRIHRVQAIERITTRAALDDDLRYTSRITGTHGSITVDARWGRAQATHLQDLRRRHRRAVEPDPPWSAGYLLLRGRPQVTPQGDTDVDATSSTVLHLTARESDHPALRSFASRADARWTIEASYEVHPDRRPDRFAVWVVPTLVPREGCRSLDIEVHWQSLGPRRYEPGPGMRKLDLVRVQVPGRWGPVENARGGDCHDGWEHPTPTVGEPDPRRGLRAIEWRNIPVIRDSRGRHCLRLRFAEPIDLGDDGVHVRVEARFAGSFSGLTGVTVHHAGGASRAMPRGVPGEGCGPLVALPFTVVELDARLRLSGLLYEDVLSLPSRSGPGSHELALPHAYPTTAPGHASVTRLADELARAGYYVKRVAENPLRAGRRPMTMNHSWSLGGRFYDGVYPIDFDLGLDGEETEAGGQAAGSTSATLQVWGAYTSEDMKERVRNEWTTLWNHIDVALSGLRREDARGLPEAAVPPPAGVEDILALLDDGLRHGDISEGLFGKLRTLLRPDDAANEEEEP